jgi:hypothetical protein
MNILMGAENFCHRQSSVTPLAPLLQDGVKSCWGCVCLREPNLAAKMRQESGSRQKEIEGR